MEKAGLHVTDSDEVDLLEYWRLLLRRKRLIGLITGGAFVLSVAVGLVMPKVYAATARVLPPQQDSTSLGATIMSQLPGGLGSIAAPYLGTTVSSKVWAEILTSQTVLDNVIRRFGLMELGDQETIEDAREDLVDRINIEESKGGIISITVEDKDPKMASDMANTFVNELDRVNKDMAMSSGGRTRVFLEKRLSEAADKLAEAEDALKYFQEKNSAVKLDDQSRAVIEALGDVKGQLMAKEVELRTLQSYAAPSNPRVGILKTEVDELKAELRKLEVGGTSEEPASGAVIIPTMRYPRLTQQYARLLRDAKIQETLYEMLVSQYEQARIQEARDSTTLQVLDRAPVPTKNTKPKRALIMLMLTSAGFVFSVALAFAAEYKDALNAKARE